MVATELIEILVLTSEFFEGLLLSNDNIIIKNALYDERVEIAIQFAANLFDTRIIDAKNINIQKAAMLIRQQDEDSTFEQSRTKLMIIKHAAEESLIELITSIQTKARFFISTSANSIRLEKLKALNMPFRVIDCNDLKCDRISPTEDVYDYTAPEQSPFKKRVADILNEPQNLQVFALELSTILGDIEVEILENAGKIPENPALEKHAKALMLSEDQTRSLISNVLKLQEHVSPPRTEPTNSDPKNEVVTTSEPEPIAEGNANISAAESETNLLIPLNQDLLAQLKTEFSKLVELKPIQTFIALKKVLYEQKSRYPELADVFDPEKIYLFMRYNTFRDLFDVNFFTQWYEYFSKEILRKFSQEQTAVQELFLNVAKILKIPAGFKLTKAVQGLQPQPQSPPQPLPQNLPEVLQKNVKNQGAPKPTNKKTRSVLSKYSKENAIPENSNLENKAPIFSKEQIEAVKRSLFIAKKMLREQSYEKHPELLIREMKILGRFINAKDGSEFRLG